MSVDRINEVRKYGKSPTLKKFEQRESHLFNLRRDHDSRIQTRSEINTFDFRVILLIFQVVFAGGGGERKGLL